MRARSLPDRALPIGKDVRTNKPASIGLKRLSEHIDVMGPTGVGKTQSVMLPLFEGLARMRDVSVIAVTCKGGFSTMCADFAIGHGLTNSLVVFRPGDTSLGFNPLRRNGWPAERHAKMARTAVLASRGEHSLDQMPQLSRLLFYASPLPWNGIFRSSKPHACCVPVNRLYAVTCCALCKANFSGILSNGSTT